MTCSLDETPIDTADILNRLKGLSSAEDFFAALGVRYDPAVLQVARLHILKRMGDYLQGDDLEGLPDRVAAARAQAKLRRAYSDFEIVFSTGSKGLSRPQGSRPRTTRFPKERVRRTRRDCAASSDAKRRRRVAFLTALRRVASQAAARRARLTKTADFAAVSGHKAEWHGVCVGPSEVFARRPECISSFVSSRYRIRRRSECIRSPTRSCVRACRRSSVLMISSPSKRRCVCATRMAAMSPFSRWGRLQPRRRFARPSPMAPIGRSC